MDRFVGMAVFVKVVEESSFAAAARHFGLSPAMVTKHIQAIEERLGARLLNRTTRRVTPTEVGRGYYERSRRIVAELEEADRAAADMQVAPRGVLKVSASFTLGLSHLTPVIAEYLAAYPEVTVELSLNDRYVDLIEEGFDLAVRIGRLPDSSLIARRLAPMHLVLVASPKYLERHGAPGSPQDLTRHNCLAYTYATTRGEWRFTAADGKPEAVQVSGRFVANSVDALRALALNGEGVILLPTMLVEQDIASSRLTRLLADYRLPEFAVHVVYPHSRHVSAKVRTFVDFLLSRFGPERGWERRQMTDPIIHQE